MKNKFCWNVQDTIISSSATLKDALKAISKSGLLMAAVTADNGKLIAILTDSDIRKSLLTGANLDDNVLDWANKDPISASTNDSEKDLAFLARSQNVREIPLVDAEGKLDDFYIVTFFEKRVPKPEVNQKKKPLPNFLFILAGGKGTRLRSVVSDRPKPLAIVGRKPALETLILSAERNGFQNFFVSVNYMAEMIEEHLRRPVYKDLNVKTVHETEYLGTAGSLGYINDKVVDPIMVCNADVLTTVAHNQILEHHTRMEADITCVVRPYQLSVPYGVFSIDDGIINGISEKPKFVRYVNAGIYVLNPEICKMVEHSRYLDMPDLILQCLAKNKKVVPYLIHEYWIDFGGPTDYEKANEHYSQHFGEFE